jgi:hypothetical protein
MTDEHRKYHGKYFLTLVFASILLVTLGISANEAFAMGQAPSTCQNRSASASTPSVGPVTLPSLP